MGIYSWEERLGMVFGGLIALTLFANMINTFLALWSQ